MADKVIAGALSEVAFSPANATWRVAFCSQEAIFVEKLLFRRIECYKVILEYDSNGSKKFNATSLVGKIAGAEI